MMQVRDTTQQCNIDAMHLLVWGEDEDGERNRPYIIVSRLSLTSIMHVDSMNRLWGRLPADENRQKQIYDLRHGWKTIKGQYDAFLPEFQMTLNALAAEDIKVDTKTDGIH